MPDVEPDTKDWTWVLARPCPECGFDPATVTQQNLPERISAAGPPWRRRLAQPDARRRPAPSVWSPTEYAAHVRDVGAVMGGRLQLILTQDDPLFENWDQDAAAIDGDYSSAEPGETGEEASAAVEQLARAFAEVSEEEWDRPGRRSNGSVFTAFTLGVYALHDLEHHLHDVSA